MHGLLQRHEVAEIVKEALESSVFVAPTEPGLTYDELFEVGSRLNLQRGEISDAVPAVAAPQYFGKGQRVMPRATGLWSQFNFPEEPDLRNVDAFDFVCMTLQKIARSEGAGRAQLDRGVLVSRGIATGLSRRDIEVAVTIMVVDEHLTEKGGVVRFAPGREMYPLPGEQKAAARGAGQAGLTRQHECRARVHAAVKDVIERRTDSRLAAAEPFDAFAEALETLGYGPFRVWWKQTVAELHHAEPSFSPVAATVFAAALVEGALTFVVKHARALGLGVLGSKDFDREPRTWKIEALVSSASAGQDSAIFDTATRQRADQLVKARQRIHAGGMLSEFPAGVPDVRPEEARAAKETAELVVRRVLDWLGRYPA